MTNLAQPDLIVSADEYEAFLEYRKAKADGAMILPPDQVAFLFELSIKASDKKERREDLAACATRLLTLLGEDPKRPGLVDTPQRFARMWDEFIHYDPGTTDTVFEGVVADQMVVVSGMPVWSMCEHHLLPMRMNVSIGVIARDKVLGLSKYARIAHKHAHKLQIQERYVKEVADEIEAMLGAPDVAVVASGVHLCMEMRGIRTHGLMTSSVMRGAFQEEGPSRAEFLALHNGHQDV
jgi:GTP cyclohydrolase I